MAEESTQRRPPRSSRGRRRPERADRQERADRTEGTERPELPGRAVTFRYPPAEGPCDDGPALELLADGELTVEGRLVAASNATLYCTIELDGQTAACVYKPVAGERPLWDFPPGTLAGREVAAYAVSQAAGWNLVPPTVMRDGPYGPGMCQLWIDADTGTDLVALARSRDQPKLRDMAVFDAAINNADRKIGHLLPIGDGRLYGCDHGVCFGEEYKLRTVLWQWRGQKLPGRALAALARLKEELVTGSLAATLPELLSEDEVTATKDRVELLIEHRVHPYPPENWPAVPWPPV
jgi:uncharacterized repeat protein (TIGR03843 family)